MNNQPQHTVYIPLSDQDILVKHNRLLSSLEKVLRRLTDDEEYELCKELDQIILYLQTLDLTDRSVYDRALFAFAMAEGYDCESARCSDNYHELDINIFGVTFPFEGWCDDGSFSWSASIPEFENYNYRIERKSPPND